MKHLPTPRRIDADDTVVQGMEAVFALALFLGLGYLLDRWLGTEPVFMIIMVVIGGVGLFARFKYSYLARMERLDAERLDAERLDAERLATRSAPRREVT